MTGIEIWAVVLLGFLFLTTLYLLTHRRRQKWRNLRNRFSTALTAEPLEDPSGAGFASLDDIIFRSTYTLASSSGVLLSRVPAATSGTIYFPWQAVAKILICPCELTKRPGWENHVKARLYLANYPELVLWIPWHLEFATFLPETIAVDVRDQDLVDVLQG